jgi:hypothetical protein
MTNSFSASPGAFRQRRTGAYHVDVLRFLKEHV